MVGEMLGRVDVALARFAHPADQRVLVWDIRHFHQLTGLVEHTPTASEARAMGTTLIFTVFAVPISLVLSTVMALGVRRAFRGARFFRSIFFLPVITSLVLAGSIFVWIFSSNGPWSALMTPPEPVSVIAQPSIKGKPKRASKGA